MADFQKVLERFLQLPAELRSKMEMQMSAADRTKVADFSISWKAQPEVSRKDIRELGFKIWDDRHVEITVKTNEPEKRIPDESVIYGYLLKFIKGEKTQMIFRSFHVGDDWIIDLETSVDIFQLAEEHFKILAKLHQDEIKELRLESIIDHKIDYGITSLNKLNTLYILRKVDVSTIIPLIKKPLVKLCVEEWKDVTELEPLIFEVQTVLVLGHVNLTMELFMKLSAKKIHLDVRELRKYDAAKLMQWLYGNTENERNYIYFKWDGTLFDPQQVGRVFDKNWEQFLKTDVRTNQCCEDYKPATVSRFRNDILTVKFYNEPLPEPDDCQIDLQNLNIVD